MKYKDKKQDITPEFRFHDDEDPEVKTKRKMPSRISAYEVTEVTKKSIVSRLAQGFGIPPHQVVLNFLASLHVLLLMIKNLIPWLMQNNLGIRILPKVNRQKSYFERRTCFFPQNLGAH
jgi:transcription elongation factor SPT6